MSRQAQGGQVDGTVERRGPTAGRKASLLSLAGVGYSYEDGPVVLDGLSLEIPEGDLIGLVGPSGCGKSTLLGILAGFISPQAGRVNRDARLVSSREDRRRAQPLTMVFQDDTILPWRTVAQNVQFGLRHADLGKRERQQRLDELLRLARIEEVRDRYPYQLSGGQRRRVQFLVSVAAGPQLLLLDEPFSALDEPTRLSVHRDILRVIREFEMTVVIVTHDLGEVVSLSDRLHLLSRRPAHVVKSYETPFGPDRDVFALRETAEFLNLYQEVWHDLRQQIEIDDD